MPDFSSIEDLVNYINKQAKEAIQDFDSEAQRTIIEVGQQHVQSDVYDVFSPSVYVRSGGLKNDWQVRDTADGIVVVNTRTDEETGNDIAYTVETGRGYLFKFPFYDVPRPFIANAVAELSSSLRLQNAVKRDLQRKGFNVE